MQSCHNKIAISIRPGFWLFSAGLLLLCPLKWVFSWLVGAVIHELAHCAVLYVYRVKILEIEVGAFVTKIQTAPVNSKTEFICAIAGPLSGLLLGCCYRYIPTIAFFALLQSLVNLIPVGQRDGRSILFYVLLRRYGWERAESVCETAERLIRYTAMILCFIGCIVLKFILPMILLASFYCIKAKIPCKPGKQIVQCQQQNPKR